MKLTTDGYRRYFQGFHVTDCVVRDRNIVYWVLVEACADPKSPPPDHARTTRIVACYLDTAGDDAWGWADMIGMDGLLAGASARPQERFVGVDLAGQVYVLGGGDNGVQAAIPTGRDGPRRGEVTRLKTLDGMLHASGGLRSLFRREGRDRWVAVGGNPPCPSKAEMDSDRSGFDDFDGFSSDDIYCAGDAGVLWHWNGKAWRPIAFPSRMYLRSICCGGDGKVYIGAQSGNVWRSRSEQWELFHEDKLSLPFKDMAWFAGTLWATSDYGLWTLRDDRIARADVPVAIGNCSGNLSIGDGIMLLSGEYGAALHDGVQWTLLFDLATLRSQCALARGPRSRKP